MEKVAIVTGAGSGIGRATAQRFYEDGYRVVLTGRTRDKLVEAARDFAQDRHLVCPADVSREEDVQRLMDQVVETYGRIDTLVNNAAIGEMTKIAETDLDDWNRQMTINVNGVFLCCKYAMPQLTKAGGSIVNLSSVSGIGGDWGGLCYNATKGAVTNFTKALALDYPTHKVRVNAVAPSLTATDMAAGVFENEELLGKFRERIPMGRACRPEEVASVIAFLAGDDATFVNGAILTVDGGLSASNGQPPLNP